MRSVTFIFFALLASTALRAQAPDATLRSELELLHAKWFQAFDSGDGAAMDQMEMEELTLVMPNGFLWAKTEPRAGKQKKLNPQTKRILSETSVRRQGDVAILTGILTSTSPQEAPQKEATTVVFVRSSGKWKIASAQWTPVVNAN